MNNNHDAEERIPLPTTLPELTAMADEIWAEYLEPKEPLTKEAARLLQSKYREVAAAANAITPKSLVSELKLPNGKKKPIHISTEATPADNKATKKGPKGLQPKGKGKKVDAEAAANTVKSATKVKNKANTGKPASTKKAATPAKATKKAAGTTERRTPLTEKEVAAIVKLIQKNTPYKQIKADFGLNSMTPIAHIKKNKMPK